MNYYFTAVFKNLTPAQVGEIMQRNDCCAGAHSHVMADRDALKVAANTVLRDALDSVEVHPCDDDRVRASKLPAEMKALYDALQAC